MHCRRHHVDQAIPPSQRHSQSSRDTKDTGCRAGAGCVLSWRLTSFFEGHQHPGPWSEIPANGLGFPPLGPWHFSKPRFSVRCEIRRWGRREQWVGEWGSAVAGVLRGILAFDMLLVPRAVLPYRKSIEWRGTQKHRWSWARLVLRSIQLRAACRSQMRNMVRGC